MVDCLINFNFIKLMADGTKESLKNVTCSQCELVKKWGVSLWDAEIILMKKQYGDIMTVRPL